MTASVPTSARPVAHALLQPAPLILLAANLVPLVGVLVCDWDAFVLLMLYWLETAVIAFWTILRNRGHAAQRARQHSFRGLAQADGALGAGGVRHAARRHLHGRAFPVSVGVVLG